MRLAHLKTPVMYATAVWTDNIPSVFSANAFPVSFISHLSMECAASIRLTNEAPSVLIFSPMFAHVQVTIDILHIGVPPKQIKTCSFKEY